MGLGDLIRRSAIGSGVRSQVKSSAIAKLRNQDGNAGDAFNQLMAGFRTDLDNHPVNRNWSFRAPAEMQANVLTFYGGAVLHLVREYQALRGSAPPFWVMVFLANHCGMDTNNDTAIVASELVKARERNDPSAERGEQAMRLWLSGDVDGSAHEFTRIVSRAFYQ